MNLDTVLMCARAMASKQMSGLGYVENDVQAIIDELTPAPVSEPEVVVEESTAEPAEVVEVAEAPEETPSEE